MPFILVILVEVFVEWVGPQKVSASNMVGSSLKNLGPYPILYTLPQLLCEDEKKLWINIKIPADNHNLSHKLL